MLTKLIPVVWWLGNWPIDPSKSQRRVIMDLLGRRVQEEAAVGPRGRTVLN